MLTDYRSDVPEGTCGPWKVERFTVTEEDARLERLRAAFSFGSQGRAVPEGTYTRLTRNGVVIMSDTPDEIRDCLHAVYRATGNVLVNGLGLGIVTELMLRKPEVEQLTAIEIAPEVASLVGDHLRKQHGERLTIITADALVWKPPKGIRYDVVWHDIWDNICADNLPTMHTLHRRYGRHTDWQGSWCRERCEWLRG